MTSPPPQRAPRLGLARRTNALLARQSGLVVALILEALSVALAVGVALGLNALVFGLETGVIAMLAAATTIVVATPLIVQFVQTIKHLDASSRRLKAARDSLVTHAAEVERAKAAAEQANTAKSQFLSTMSHELRTPLTTIVGFVELMQADAETNASATSMARLKKIDAAAAHLNRIVGEVLDLSKIEAGKMKVELRDIDLSETIVEIAELAAPLIARSHNRFRFQRPPAPIPMITDETKVRQILLNLLGNAAKFCRDGEVSLTVSDGRDAHPDWIRITITDTGIGMTPEQIESLFSPFTQADASTTRKFGGTGLGLALTRMFCDLLGGTVSANSIVDRGSVFTLVLPRDSSRASGTHFVRDSQTSAHTLH